MSRVSCRAHRDPCTNTNTRARAHTHSGRTVAQIMRRNAHMRCALYHTMCSAQRTPNSLRCITQSVILTVVFFVCACVRVHARSIWFVVVSLCGGNGSGDCVFGQCLRAPPVSSMCAMMMSLFLHHRHRHREHARTHTLGQSAHRRRDVGLDNVRMSPSPPLLVLVPEPWCHMRCAKDLCLITLFVRPEVRENYIMCCVCACVCARVCAHAYMRERSHVHHTYNTWNICTSIHTYRESSILYSEIPVAYAFTSNHALACECMCFRTTAQRA